MARVTVLQMSRLYITHILLEKMIFIIGNVLYRQIINLYIMEINQLNNK